jgi:hypothetical protein
MSEAKNLFLVCDELQPVGNMAVQLLLLCEFNDNK